MSHIETVKFFPTTTPYSSKLTQIPGGLVMVSSFDDVDMSLWITQRIFYVFYECISITISPFSVFIVCFNTIFQLLDTDWPAAKPKKVYDHRIPLMITAVFLSDEHQQAQSQKK
jgi:hypothetical protein